jgi:PAS domain S-box-containing protein
MTRRANRSRHRRRSRDHYSSLPLRLLVENKVLCQPSSVSLLPLVRLCDIFETAQFAGWIEISGAWRSSFREPDVARTRRCEGCVVQDQAAHASKYDGKSEGGSPPLARIRTTWRCLNRWHRGIGLRLLARVLLFSSAITLLLTLLQLYFDYRRDVGTIDRQISEIEGSYRRSLGEGLWNLDARQLELQADGILHLPDIRFVEVREATDRADPMVVTAGSHQANADVHRDFPIFHMNRGAEQTLGVLSIEATLDDVYRRLFDTAIFILISQGAKTFVVSFFIVYIVHRLITRHLVTAAKFLGGYDLRRSPPPLRLERRPLQQVDELDQLVGAFNGMCASLQTAYGELRDSEAKIRRLVEANIIGIVIWELGGRIIEANDAFLHMVGHDRGDLASGCMRWTDLTPAEWRERDERAVAELKSTRAVQPYEKQYFRKNGSRVPVLVGAALFEESRNEGVAFVLDLSEGKRAEEALRELQSDLAHMNRLSMMGELAASLVHEITQPIAAARNNARAALNFLDRQPPELGEVSEALACVVGDADRAGEIIGRIRDHIRKAPPRKARFDLNDAIDEVIVLGRSAVTKNEVLVQTRLAEGLFPVRGDRVQLQQVILNLVLNAVEAMSSVEAGPRELLISTEQTEANGVLVAFRDSGPGIDPEHVERVFEAFYTTKSGGVGMGLSICRSIIDAHGGRLWADANEPRGAIFKFTLPSAES